MPLWEVPGLLESNSHQANPSWVLHLRAQVPGLVMLLLALLLPDPGGYDATKYPTAAYEESDSGKSKTLTEIMQFSADKWHEVNGGHQHGLRTSTNVMWYRIQVPKSSAAESLVAEVGYHMMRKVDFYLTDGSRLLSSVSRGIERPQAIGDVYPRLNFTAELSRDSKLYLRIEADAAIVVPFFIGPDADYRVLSIFRRCVHGLGLGVIFGLILYNLGLYLTLRQTMYAFFLLAQVMSAAFAFLFAGQSGVFWPGSHLNLARHSNLLCESILLTQLFLLIFDRYYIARHRNAYRNERVEKSLVLCTLSSLVVSPFASPSILIVVFGGVLSAISFSALIYRARKMQVRGIFYYYNFYYGLISGVLIAVASWLGLLTASFFSHFMTSGALIWGALAMSAALSRRILDLENDHKNLAKSLVNKHFSPIGLHEGDASEGVISQSREVDVSIMYIDIVSFSLIADQKDRGDLFSELSTRLASLTKIVEGYNGVVDRSLGDGLLCFFGDKAGSSGQDHTYAAFSAAKAIQELILREVIEGSGTGSSAKEALRLPVRIGIHSDRVLFGNMGTNVRVDFTMVGQGVYLASNLERACGPFHVMISTSCHARLLQHGMDISGFSPVHISLNHQNDLVQAFEFNPFYNRPSDLKHAMTVYFKQLGMHPRYKRNSAGSKISIELKAAGATFRILDFSLHGFRVVSDVYFAQRSILQFTIDMQQAEFNQILYNKMLETVTAEVRWSRKSEVGFEHGLKILGCNAEQLEFLFKMILKRVSIQQDSVNAA